jgi:hypothetical protein
VAPTYRFPHSLLQAYHHHDGTPKTLLGKKIWLGTTPRLVSPAAWSHAIYDLAITEFLGWVNMV